MNAIGSQITVSIIAQSFVQAQMNENIKLRVTGLRDGNSPMTGKFPH